MATDPKVQQVKDYMVKNPGSSYTEAAQSVVGIPKESLGDKNRRLQADFANKTAPAVTTPAIAQPAPTIAPITPVAPIAKQDYGFMGANNAPVQTNIAPVVPPSSVSTPQATTVAPTPIEAPKTETLGEKNARQQAEFAKTTKATTPTVDFNTSTGREQDILKNLNEAFNNAPALFQNQESYRQAYGYDTADQGKKAILDSFFAGKQAPTDTNSIFATLLSGGQITNPQITNTAEYKSAVGRIDKVNTIKGYDQSQISTLLAEGKLVPGTQLYKDLSTDPATLAKITNAQKLNVINKVAVNKDNVLANAAETVIDETPLGKAFKDGYISAEEADSFTRTPEIKAKEIEIEKKKTAYDALKAEYDDMENSVREELKGKASEGYIQALIGERQKNIFKRLNVLSSDYSNAMGTYSDMKKSLADTFQLNVGLYKDKQATAAAAARDDKNFAQQKEMISLQQAYQNPDINSKDPQIAQIATQKLIDESLKFAQTNGVPVTRNSGAILADAKAYAQKNGVSLAQAIQTTFTDPLTQKPEYQAALDNIRSKNEPAGKLQVIGQRVDPATGSVVNVYGTVDKSGNIIEATNTNTNTANQTSNDYAPGANSLKSLASKYPGVAAFKNDNPAGITWNANFDNGTGTAKALQDAGINFSKGTARPAKEGGNYVNFDSIEDGLAAQRIIMEKTYGNSTVATLLSSWVGTGEGSAYANQVANMAGIDKNTTVNKLSQQQLDALQIAKIKKESPGLYNELQNKGVVDGNTINFSKVAPVDYNTALGSDGVAGDFARSLGGKQFTTTSSTQGTQGQGEVTQVEKDTFKFAESLTPNEASTFLKKKGLLDKYITYKATQDTPNSLEGISSIDDIIFPEKTTEFKTKSYNYGTRMDQAEKAINNMSEKYKNSWTSTEYLAPRGDYVPNFLKSSDRQVYEQAQRNFINAVLRQESGAAIGKDEFDNAKIQYFPASGDSEEVLNTKKTNRETVIFNMLKSAGKDEKGRDIGNIWKNLRVKEAKPDINSALQNFRNSK